MKKILILGLVLGLTVVFLAARPVSAHRVHFGIGFGFWGPPVYYAPPPVVYTPPPVYYPPPAYYPPRAYYPPYG